MTTIRRIAISEIEGSDANNDNINRIKPYGEIGLYENETGHLDLLIFDGKSTHVNSKVLSNGVFYGSRIDNSSTATIKLIPDVNQHLQGSNRHLQIESDTNFIRIRAGGTIDQSTATVYIGGNNNHVSISDSGHVHLEATEKIELIYQAGTATLCLQDGFNYITAGSPIRQSTWYFDSMGSMLYPDGTFQNTAWAGGKVVQVPAESQGEPDHREGDLAFDENYFYYCWRDYNGDQESIWRRIPWEQQPW
jgi:hypothetical protein